jgi:hypothetical protein
LLIWHVYLDRDRSIDREYLYTCVMLALSFIYIHNYDHDHVSLIICGYIDRDVVCFANCNCRTNFCRLHIYSCKLINDVWKGIKSLNRCWSCFNNVCSESRLQMESVSPVFGMVSSPSRYRSLLFLFSCVIITSVYASSSLTYISWRSSASCSYSYSYSCSEFIESRCESRSRFEFERSQLSLSIDSTWACVFS